jgi:hypothetical protein
MANGKGRLNLVAPEDMLGRLRAEADRHGLTYSDYILRRLESPPDAARFDLIDKRLEELTSLLRAWQGEIHRFFAETQKAHEASNLPPLAQEDYPPYDAMFEAEREKRALQERVAELEHALATLQDWESSRSWWQRLRGR